MPDPIRINFFNKVAHAGGEPGILLVFVYFLPHKQRLIRLGCCAPPPPRNKKMLVLKFCRDRVPGDRPQKNFDLIGVAGIFFSLHRKKRNFFEK